MINQNSLTSQVIGAIQSVVGKEIAPLHEPSFIGNEWLYVKDCLDSTFVSSVGEFVDRFELDLASYTGSKYAVAVINGTSALHIALKIAGVKSNDEVLVPALTFVASANAISYCNAIPHFIDSDESSLGVHVDKLNSYLKNNTEQRGGKCFNLLTGRNISAIVPMHTFGHPCDMDGLLSIANDFNIVMVEDAAESLGSFYHGKHTGTFGLLGTLSFNGNKTITTGGGGAILTNDANLASYAKHLTTTAKLKHSWEYLHDEVGYNYRMPNLNAALGCAQIEQLPKILKAKRALFDRYKIAFEHIEGVSLVTEPDNCSSNYWLQTLLLNSNFLDQKDKILKATNKVNLMTRPAWKLINELEPYIDFPCMDLKNSESLSQRLINIPSSSNLIPDKL